MTDIYLDGYATLVRSSRFFTWYQYAGVIGETHPRGFSTPKASGENKNPGGNFTPSPPVLPLWDSLPPPGNYYLPLPPPPFGEEGRRGIHFPQGAGFPKGGG